MTTINDGGPAFPVLSYEYKATGDLHPCPTIQSGMTLRDWFAGMALPELIAMGGQLCPSAQIQTELTKVAAITAYAFADAMIAARNQ